MSTAEVAPSTVGEPVRPQLHDDFWTNDPERFDFDLDHGHWIGKAMEALESKHLWHQTCLQLITAKKNGSSFLDVQSSFLYENEAMTLDPSKPDQEGNANIFELFSISGNLQTNEDQKRLPSEEADLFRVSSKVLRHLASTYHIPTAFLSAVCNPLDFYGTVFRRQSRHEWDYWCLFPCRTATSEGYQHIARTNQMDPSQPIIFDGQRVYIYNLAIALYMKRDCKTGKTHVFVVDRGGRESIRLSLAQVQKSLERRSSVDLEQNPCFALLIYIAFMLKWWNAALRLFNIEMIAHETTLQRLIADETEGFIDTSKVLNAALHSMAAHLHRYKTELYRIDLVLSDLRKHREEMTYKLKPEPRGREEHGKQEDEKEEAEEASSPIDRELQKIEQLASQLAVISSSADEMERKVQNVLALLFNQIQAINDKTLQAILNASQQETRISQRLSLASHMLSRSMKRDSIAMKTIAIMTLVFLPGTTFAAIFAMPFFTENKYLSSPSQVWIWVILTVVCTAFAFGGYIHVVQRGESTLGDPEDENDITVSSDDTTASNAPSAVEYGENTSFDGNKQHWWQRVSQKASQGGIELRARMRS